MLVGSLHEDLGKDPGPWTHGNSTLSKKFNVAHANYVHVNFPLLLVYSSGSLWRSAAFGGGTAGFAGLWW